MYLDQPVIQIQSVKELMENKGKKILMQGLYRGFNGLTVQRKSGDFNK